MKRGAKRPRVMSRLPPLPGALSTAKPALRRPSRTARAALHVATVASGVASRAIALYSRASHIAGLRAGAKPSRKNASTRATSCGSQAATSPKASSSSTRPASKAMRCRFHVSGGHCPASSSASGSEERIARDRGEVGARRRRAFDRDEVELAAALCVGAPRGPGGEEIGAETEAGLEDDEALAAAPARGQRVAVEKDVTCLRERAVARVVDVAVLGRARRAVGITHDRGGADRRRVHRGVAVVEAPRAASQASSRLARAGQPFVREHVGRHARERGVQPGGDLVARDRGDQRHARDPDREDGLRRIRNREECLALAAE